MAANSAFASVFGELRAILAEYEPALKVVHDRPDNYYLDTHTIGANKHPIFFGGVKIGKNYVSYYLMPIYAGMMTSMSPALKKRMQGKACFNFKEKDPALFAELAAITKQGFEHWRSVGWVK